MEWVKGRTWHRVKLSQVNNTRHYLQRMERHCIGAHCSEEGSPGHLWSAQGEGGHGGCTEGRRAGAESGTRKLTRRTRSLPQEVRSVFLFLCCWLKHWVQCIKHGRHSRAIVIINHSCFQLSFPWETLFFPKTKRKQGKHEQNAEIQFLDVINASQGP